MWIKNRVQEHREKAGSESMRENHAGRGQQWEMPGSKTSTNSLAGAGESGLKSEDCEGVIFFSVQCFSVLKHRDLYQSTVHRITAQMPVRMVSW